MSASTGCPVEVVAAAPVVELVTHAVAEQRLSVLAEARPPVDERERVLRRATRMYLDRTASPSIDILNG